MMKYRATYLGDHIVKVICLVWRPLPCYRWPGVCCSYSQMSMWIQFEVYVLSDETSGDNITIRRSEANTRGDQ